MSSYDVYIDEAGRACLVGVLVGFIVVLSSFVLMGLEAGRYWGFGFGLFLIGFLTLVLAASIGDKLGSFAVIREGSVEMIFLEIFFLGWSVVLVAGNPFFGFFVLEVIGLYAFFYLLDISLDGMVNKSNRLISRRKLRKKLVYSYGSSVLIFDNLAKSLDVDDDLLRTFVTDLLEKGSLRGTLTDSWFLSDEYAEKLRNALIDLSRVSVLNFKDLGREYGVDANFIESFVKDLRKNGFLKGSLTSEWFVRDGFSEGLRDDLEFFSRRSVLVFEDLEERYRVGADFLRKFVNDLLESGVLCGTLTDEWFLSDEYAESLRKNLVDLSRGWVLVFKDLEKKFDARADVLKEIVKDLVDKGELSGILTRNWFLSDDHGDYLGNKLKELSGRGVLVFGDLEESLGVGVDVLKRVVKGMLGKGVLRGVFTDGRFVSVDYAKDKIMELFSRYDEVWWKTLMNELAIDKEEDLIGLVSIMKLSGDLSVRVDEGNKSLILGAEIEVVRKSPIGLSCPNCGAEVEEGASLCGNCLEEFQRCVVCNLPVLDDLSESPCCGAYAHRTHLKEWLKIKGKCPNCGGKLKEWEIP